MSHELQSLNLLAGFKTISFKKVRPINFDSMEPLKLKLNFDEPLHEHLAFSEQATRGTKETHIHTNTIQDITVGSSR